MYAIAMDSFIFAGCAWDVWSLAYLTELRMVERWTEKNRKLYTWKTAKKCHLSKHASVSQCLAL